MYDPTPIETEIIERLLSYEDVPDDAGDDPYEQLAELAKDPAQLEPRWMCNQPVAKQLEPIIDALMAGDQHRANQVSQEAGDETERLALWLESWARPIWDVRGNQWVEGHRERADYGWANAVAFAIRHGVGMEDLNCAGNWNQQRLRIPLAERAKRQAK
jgi:hypothetical protein